MRSCLVRPRLLLFHRRIFTNEISRNPGTRVSSQNDVAMTTAATARAAAAAATTTTSTPPSTSASASTTAAAAAAVPDLPVPGEPVVRAALRVLNAPTADLKARIGAEAARLWREGKLELPDEKNASLDPPAPSRPAREDGAVTIVAPQKVRRLKNGGTLQSRLAILHSLCHIESWAIDLSWDIIARFGRDPRFAPHLPREFFDDFVRVADDEGRHFLLLRERLEALGSHYGAFEAHDALWHSAAETADSLPARLAVEHAVHEARGLDVMPLTLQKMKLDPESQALLREVVYPEEITHCAAGVRWLRHLHRVATTTDERGDGGDEQDEWTKEARSHPTVESWFHSLVRKHFSGSLKPPFNDEARKAAGFEESWYLPLALDDEKRRKEQAERARREVAKQREEEEVATAAAAALAAGGACSSGRE
jgi:uncharacterized ferritin-like protein (DUF455 family)